MTENSTSTRPPLVLIANDQEWSARSLESILGPEGYSVLRAYTGRQALERIRSARPDAIILDSQLPDISAIEVCQSLRDDPRFNKTVPILVTTAGPSGRQQRLEAYRAGAWEFLGQPLDGEAFLLKIRTFLGCRQAVEAILDKSLLDEATGLYNMRGLARRAREVGSEAHRHHHSLACVVFSTGVADHGARAEDTAPSGDAEEVGRLLRSLGRSSDILGRLGANEFAVLCPATDATGARGLVSRLQEAAEAMVLPGRPGPLRLFAGYCAVPDFADVSLDAIELVLRATTALRQLAQSGASDRVRAFEAANAN